MILKCIIKGMHCIPLLYKVHYDDEFVELLSYLQVLSFAILAF